MKIVVTGGRDYEDEAMIYDVLDGLSPTTLFVGDCPTGADRVAREWAETTGVELRVFEADWTKHGKAAGPVRNGQMLNAAGPDCFVVAFKGGRGTSDCARQAVGKNMIVLRVEA